MATTYSKTDNYGLNLYGDNDPADLRDGYNGSMRTVDTALKQHLDRIGNTENTVKTLLGDNTTQKANEAKAKWDNAATDASYAKNKADGNGGMLAALGVNNTGDASNAKTKWNNAATDASYAKSKADGNGGMLAALGVNNTGDASNAKTKWNNAATDASYAKSKANENGRQIELLKARTTLRYDHILAIGDSITYGTGTSNPSQDGWVYKLAKQVGTSKSNITNAAQNNAGFLAAGSGDGQRNFRQQLEYAKSLNLNLNNTDCIIIAGGINDSEQDPVSIARTVRETLQYATSTWPNATVWYIPSPIAGALGHFGGGIKNVVMLNRLISGARGLNVHMIKYAWEWLNTWDGVSSDNIHPNTQGAQVFSEFVYSGMMGNEPRANRGAELITLQDPSGVESGKNKMWVSVVEGFCQITGHLKLAKQADAFKRIFNLPAGFQYRGYLPGMESDVNEAKDLFYPDNNADNTVNPHATLRAGTTIYANCKWQIGVS